jgi:hydrogenase maturation protease
MKTLVIGLGNPILGDDGAGWAVAEQVRARLGPDSPIEVDCAALGGLSLMERMVGYGRVILIDVLETGRGEVGSVHVFRLEDLPNPSAGHTVSMHDTTLMTALRTAESMGIEIPRSVHVVAIEAHGTFDFSEELSAPVANAVHEAVEETLRLVK